MGLGVTELIVIFLIVVVLFGATRLPKIGKGLGEGIKNFKKGLGSQNELASSEQEEKDEDAKD